MAYGNSDYPSLPELVSLSPTDLDLLRNWWGNFVNELHKRDSGSFVGAANGRPFYNLTTVSINRDFDVSAATLAQTKVFLGTLATDLKNKGIIS